jgi:hypothetical protein
MNTVFNSLGTSFYPVGMGLSVNLRNQGGYKTWKGDGINSNPVGIAPGHIRPLTNNDMGNVFPAPFGKPRPLKQYRKGRVIPNVDVIVLDQDVNGQVVYKNQSYYPETQAKLIQYNLNRNVKSSKGTSLGGGFGGSGLLNEMQDKPGCYLVKQNPENETNEITQSNQDCTTCQGVSIVDTYYPNKTYLTENPEPNTENSVLCCNQEKFALRRVIYANTNLPKNYYTTHKQYLQNRCKLYDQKVFNFKTPESNNNSEIISSNNPYVTPALIAASKPGDPLSIDNIYYGNCQANSELATATENNLVYALLNILLAQNAITSVQYQNYIQNYGLKFNILFNYLHGLPEANSVPSIEIFTAFVNNPYSGVPLSGPSNGIGCKLTVYKPNNPQFAQQGAVDSSTRILKLNVTTIEKNAYNTPFLYKNKPAPPCEKPPLNFFPTTYQNNKACRYLRNANYSSSILQLNSPFSRLTNHYRQSPNGKALL